MGRGTVSLRARWALALLALVWAGCAAFTVVRTVQRGLEDGPNSVGEEGRLYYGLRVQRGDSVFDDGRAPPYYASFHGPVLPLLMGHVGRVLDLPPHGLYGVGRVLSALATVWAGLCVFGLASACGASRRDAACTVLLWASALALFEHAASARPDPLNLAVALSACWVVVARPHATWALPALAGLAALGFFVKAPGVWVAGAAGGTLWLDGRRRAGVWVFFGGLVLTSGLVLAVDAVTGGAFTLGLRSGAQTATTWRLAWAVVARPYLWVVWVLAVWVAWRAWPGRGGTECGTRRARWVVGWWLLCAGLVAAWTARRIGSNTYYFAEAWALGCVLCARGWTVWVRSPRERGRWRAAVAALILAGFWGWVGWTATSRGPDFTQSVTVQVGVDREALAAEIEARGWRVFSDDAALNALLPEPEVIYPFTLYDGRLPEGHFEDLARERAWDVVLVHGQSLNYFGNVWGASKDTYDAIKAAYPLVGPLGGYVVFVAPRCRGEVVRFLHAETARLTD